MSGSWQPSREVPAELVYRSMFNSAEPDLRSRAAELFASWATGKNVPVSAAQLLTGGGAEAEADDTHRVVRGSVGAYTDRSTGRRLQAAVFRLEERLADGNRWTTSLRIAVPHQAEQAAPFAETGEPATLFGAEPPWPQRSWVWLDLEHHRVPETAPVRPGSPRLIRDLLAEVEGTDASLPLTSEVLDITEGHIDELRGWLFDPSRRVPVIVFSPDPQQPEDQARFARRLARDVTGVAVVVRLHNVASAAAFNRRVGTHLQVYGGGMRTYLPGLTPNEPFPRRHRILSAASMRALGQRSANAVRDQVLTLSTRRPPPASYVLVRRALSRGSAARTMPDRRTPAEHPALFPTPGEPTLLPGLSGSVTAPEVPAPAETAERNRLLRATLTLAGVDPSAIALVDEPAEVETLTAERLALQDLLLRSMAANAGAGEKLAEAGAEIAMLYAEIDDLTVQLTEEQKMRGEVEDLRLGWELGEIELTDLERDNERLRARIRWLESELSAHHVHVAGQETPGQMILPGNVVETLELAARLPFLSIGATSDAAAGLDVHPQAERWAIKIWQALAALNAYAEARSTGAWTNSFLAWCQAPPSGGAAVPATWVALSESETTTTMPRLREARTFAVPVQVEASGRAYMQAHIKIQQGGTPCPRIHFHDDTGGRTRRIHIGYVGDHLPTASFR
ncbi:hypothetical protein GCM10010112_59590 [Actinoplanes lobatus]|uniref:Uncharacterized protein n=1 Tax=Actinoplanes lobatus TaxID=113568 RepID=A0A7W7HR36_9ACTN|nr:hypothetical protein [Actinoplanes lobatus]MBB4755054.1 hypothetical protein [Actinoplanes lobatus]GGN82324.1 hypothetical protein GCM10010112_59590 [Actinoplanes lobatus]GIE40628.1 hypothetical protein Alo02nite_35260 [Actinoplanes lobatus]